VAVCPGALPSTSRRAISLVPGGKRGTVRSRDHHKLPPGAKLIGLHQVDGRAQKELCRGCRSKPGANALVLQR